MAFAWDSINRDHIARHHVSLDAYAKHAGLSRSQLIADAIEQRMGM